MNMYVYLCPMMKIIKLFILLSIIINPAFTQSLSIDECVRIALDNKSSIRRAEQDVEIAKLNQYSSLASILPSVSVNNSFRETTYGNSSDMAEQYSAGISLSQNVFNFGNNLQDVRGGRNNFLITKLQERGSRANIIFNVYSSYYQFLKDSELLEIANKDFSLSEKQLELVEEQYNLGAVSKTDFLKASVRFGTAKSNLLSRKLNKDNSFNKLLNSMGLIDSDISIQLPKKVDIFFVVPSYQEALALMISNNPDLNILDRQIVSSKINVQQSWAGMLPSVRLSIGMNAVSDASISSEFFNDNYIKNTNLTLSIPIFTGTRNRNNVQISKIRLNQSESKYSSVLKDSKVDLYQLINTLNNFQEIIPIQEEVLKSAEEDLKLAQNKYELGSASILELLDAQLASIQASSSLISTKYDAAIQVANLDRLLGTLDKKYQQGE